MPMITCSDCNNEMSDSAKSCPKCGKPNPNAPPEKRSVGFLLGLGIVIFPLIFSWFTLRKGHTSIARIISFVWLLVALAMLGGQGRTGNVSSNSPAKLSATASDQIVNVEISELLSAYTKNEIGADNKYKGKVVKTTGIIGDVKKDMTDSLYVSLGTGSMFEIPTFQAFFPKSMNERLGQLVVGTKLTVVCRVKGLMMNVLATDCIIE